MHQAHDARPETSSLKAPPPSAPDFAGPAVDKPTCRPSLCQIWCPSPECPPPSERSRRRRVGRRFVASAAGGLLAGEAAALTMTSLVRVPPAEASSAGQLPLPDRGAPVPTTAWLVIGLDGTRRLAFGRDRPPPTLLCFFPSDSEPEVRARFRSDRIVCGNLANNAAGETSPLVAEPVILSARRGTPVPCSEAGTWPACWRPAAPRATSGSDRRSNSRVGCRSSAAAVVDRNSPHRSLSAI